ncbi:MAG: hypothetical protein KJO21_02515 [Verrucomicrobiae bacterium]|nr:hypothetical protein [Verrucomicrobiae bacterium]NNJ44172.1 hypothetical protein [Akkermansiaceae bacterium]
MKTIVTKLSVVAATAIALMITSCGDNNSASSAPDTPDTPDSLTDELLVKMDQLVEAIASAKDKESAEKAAETIDAIGDDFSAIAQRLGALDEPSEDVKKQLDEKMNKAMEANQDKMMAAMQAISSNQDGMAIIGQAMQAFGDKMKDSEAIFKKFGAK